MLVLTRKVDESVLIGENVEVKIVDIDQGRVKLGIIAPANVEILRPDAKNKTKRERNASLPR